MEKLKAYVAYYRVSTQRQGASGLGLDSQRSAVLQFIKSNGNRIIKEFTEIESGKNNKRPELLKAIEFAQQNDCTLIVAKLDRLSRDMNFITALMASKVKFIAADMPEANSLTLHIIAALAEYERKMISERTRSALQAKKQREPEWVPGKNNFTDEGRLKSQKILREGAQTSQANRFAFHFIKPLREKGVSYERIAEMLNQEGYKTRRGKTFSKMQVFNIMKRFGK